MNVQVVLTVDDPKLGKRGEIVKVAPGHAYNFLIPHAKAKLATPSNLKSFEAEKQKNAKEDAANRVHAENLRKQIAETPLILEVQVGEGDKLYGAVTSLDIQNALKARGISLEKKEIHLEEPIHKLGVFELPIKLHPEINAVLKVSVIKKK